MRPHSEELGVSPPYVLGEHSSACKSRGQEQAVADPAGPGTARVGVTEAGFPMPRAPQSLQPEDSGKAVQGRSL